MSAPEIVTFGCRLNAYESEVIRDHARAGGIDNAIIFNTCAVTGEAVRQARQAIRKARRDHPDAEIIVTGCAAQIEPETFAKMPEVSRIVGNAEKTKAETFLKGSNAPRVAVADIMDVRETAGHLIAGFEARARAFVEVQNGCDHRCTFCVIPYGRGNSRSVAAGEVVTQIRQLVENGTQEIVLTGVDLTSWGGDLPGTPPLGNLVQRILKLVPELPRLRLSSIDSIEADPDLMRAIADEERLMPHLHLSLQHGHDMILKRMKRRHARADAIAFCDEARRLRPEIAFGADIMAGFPTETDDMHAANLSLIDACGLTHVHVFPYSPRPMTPAAKMPPVDGATIKARAAELRTRGTQALAASLDTHVGRTVRLLAERETEGHTDDFASIRLTHAVTPGSIIEAQVTGRDGTTLIATPKVSARRMTNTPRIIDLGADAPAQPDEPEKKGLFKRLREGLSRSTSSMTTGIASVFTKRKLDGTTIEELEDLLIQADLGVETATAITDAVSDGRYDKEVDEAEVRSIVANEVAKVLEPVEAPLLLDGTHTPHIILVVGVNGAGKTTTIGKLAKKISAAGKSVVLGAGDTFRAAAIDQLKIWGDRIGAPVVAHNVGADSAGLAFDTITKAEEVGADVVMIDTAGRLQNKTELMSELEKVVRVIKKRNETAPHSVLLVLDATTGQNALNQVEVFTKAVGVTGLVMTKLDGTARGGILVAIAKKSGLPVHAIGVGEGEDDLQPFIARNFAQAIAGLDERQAQPDANTATSESTS